MDTLAQQVGAGGAILLVALYLVLKMRPWDRQKGQDEHCCLNQFVCKYDSQASADIREIRDGILRLVVLIERNGGRP
jgi:hypothetical protein